MRNQSVTIAKALAIIFMVSRHAGSPTIINDYLQLVRMPLFFFMSGYCFKEKYLNTTVSFVKKRFKGIYWPYVKWSLFFLLIHNFLVSLCIYPKFQGNTLESNIYVLDNYIFNAWHIISRMDCHDQLLGGYWFLKTLFWGSIIFFITRKIFKNYFIIGSIVLLILAIVLSYYNWQIPFFCIQTKEFFAAFLISMGHIYRSRKWHFEQSWIYIFVSAFIVGVGSLFIKCAMTDYSWTEIMPFALFSIIGTLMIFGISAKIANTSFPIIKNHLDYIGSHTFHVLTWHFLSMKIVTLLFILIFSLPMTKLSSFPVYKQFAHQGWWIVYTIIGVEIPILWMKMYDSITLKYNNTKIFKA